MQVRRSTRVQSTGTNELRRTTVRGRRGVCSEVESQTNRTLKVIELI